MEEPRLKALLDKYLAGTATTDELAEIDEWYNEFDPQPSRVDRLNDTQRWMIGERMLGKINEHLFAEPEEHRIRSLWRRIAAVASIALVCSVTGYFLLHRNHPQDTITLAKNDVLPGGTQAILTLSNGQKIVLGSQKGKIASQGSSAVVLNAKGQVAYQPGQAGSNSEVLYNTLTVPIGNHRDLTLSDGTEVNLDAGSSITYPVAFTGKERQVSITGQAYFTVKHDAAHPFQVKVKDLVVRDIGTEFNINSYEDEPGIKTTLVEGSIKVNDRLIQPGEQALAANGNIAVAKVDVEAVTAWRSNNFLFRKQDLHTTMQQISRWYKVNIIYDQAPQNVRVYADISRERKLSAILHAIEETCPLHFTIEGHTVRVTGKTH